MVKTRIWVFLILAILVLAAAASALVLTRPAPGTVAEITVDGELLRTVDLSKVTEPERFTVTTDRGENVILLEPGRICVESADCPDQICVKAGWLADSAAPIVCLPHRLVIELGGETELDAEAG